MTSSATVRRPRRTAWGFLLGATLLAGLTLSCSRPSLEPDEASAAPGLTLPAATPMQAAIPQYVALLEALEDPFRGNWDEWPRDPDSGDMIRLVLELRVEGEPATARIQVPLAGADAFVHRVSVRDPSVKHRRTSRGLEEAGLDDPFSEGALEVQAQEVEPASEAPVEPHAEVDGPTVIVEVTATGFRILQADPDASLADAPSAHFTFSEGATWGRFHAALRELNEHGIELASFMPIVPSRAVFVD